MWRETFLQPRGTRDPSTAPFKKLLNGADRLCAATENRGAANVTRTGKGILILKKLRFSLTGRERSNHFVKLSDRGVSIFRLPFKN
jgi:hypothetical protein